MYHPAIPPVTPPTTPPTTSPVTSPVTTSQSLERNCSYEVNVYTQFSKIGCLVMNRGLFAYLTSRPLLYEIKALQIYTCADRVYVINCYYACARSIVIINHKYMPVCSHKIAIKMRLCL